MEARMIAFTIPGALLSEPNQRGGWKTKHFGRTEPARRKAMTLCPAWKLGPLLVVHLVRFGIRELDDDNLQGAFKATRDGIASRLGVDDRSKLIKWTYAQWRCAKGEERVEVVITPARMDSADGMLSIDLKHLRLGERDQ